MVVLDQADLLSILRVLRADRDRNVEACMLLQERIRTIGDGERAKMIGEVNLAIAELTAINALIEKVWQLLHAIRH